MHPPEHLNVKEKHNLGAMTECYDRFHTLDEIDGIDDPDTKQGGVILFRISVGHTYSTHSYLVTRNKL